MSIILLLCLIFIGFLFLTQSLFFNANSYSSHYNHEGILEILRFKDESFNYVTRIDWKNIFIFVIIIHLIFAGYHFFGDFEWHFYIMIFIGILSSIIFSKITIKCYSNFEKRNISHQFKTVSIQNKYITKKSIYLTSIQMTLILSLFLMFYLFLDILIRNKYLVSQSSILLFDVFSQSSDITDKTISFNFYKQYIIARSLIFFSFGFIFGSFFNIIKSYIFSNHMIESEIYLIFENL